MLYCPACEAPTAERTDLGFIGNDGTTGRVAGVACRACGYLREDPDAALIPEGRVDLGGLTAFEWFVRGLAAAGCNPRPRP